MGRVTKRRPKGVGCKRGWLFRAATGDVFRSVFFFPPTRTDNVTSLKHGPITMRDARVQTIYIYGKCLGRKMLCLMTWCLA